MSIIGSIYTASTAIDAFGNSMGVVGHNIANLNTIGFKASEINFADLLPTVLGEVETGQGVQVVEVRRPFRQGAIETTKSVTDLAVNGPGYFVLNDANGGTFYSRAGQFSLDKDFNLVNPAGLRLQGLSGNISLAGLTTVPAVATTTLGLRLNLDASSTTPAATFPAGPDASPSAWISASNFSLITPVYDADGKSHDLTFLFRKIAPNMWDYRVVAKRSELDASAPISTDLRLVSAGGSLVFTSGGDFDPAASSITDISGLNWVGGTASQSIAAGSLNFTGTVQFSQPSGLLSHIQDGFGTGSLTNMAIDSQGVMTARYSNGQFRNVGTVVLASFTNEEGLEALGDTLFGETLDSGPAQIGVAGQGGRGLILSGALELSTVDLAKEFVGLIISQRSFQMNARVLAVADEMSTVAAELST